MAQYTLVQTRLSAVLHTGMLGEFVQYRPPYSKYLPWSIRRSYPFAPVSGASASDMVMQIESLSVAIAESFLECVDHV